MEGEHNTHEQPHACTTAIEEARRPTKQRTFMKAFNGDGTSTGPCTRPNNEATATKQPTATTQPKIATTAMISTSDAAAVINGRHHRPRTSPELVSHTTHCRMTHIQFRRQHQRYCYCVSCVRVGSCFARCCIADLRRTYPRLGIWFGNNDGVWPPPAPGVAGAAHHV